MPKVTCPACECWGYLVLTPGDIAHLFAGDPPERCTRLQQRIEAGEAIKDLLACADMAMAVEVAIGGASDIERRADVDPTSHDPLASWLEAPHSRRRFVRQKTNLSANISVAGTKRQCAVGDVSPRGALISLHDTDGLETGTYVAFTPVGYRAIPAEVRHVDESEDTAGLMLLHGPAEQTGLAQWFAALGSSSRSQVSGVP